MNVGAVSRRYADCWRRRARRALPPTISRNPFTRWAPPTSLTWRFLATVAAHMGTPPTMRCLLDTITVHPARLLRRPDYGLTPGSRRTWWYGTVCARRTPSPRWRRECWSSKAGRITIEARHDVIERWAAGVSGAVLAAPLASSPSDPGRDGAGARATPRRRRACWPSPSRPISCFTRPATSSRRLRPLRQHSRGSLNQVLIPSICAGYFVWHRQPAAAAVMLFWVGESVTDVAILRRRRSRHGAAALAEGLIHDWTGSSPSVAAQSGPSDRRRGVRAGESR